MSITGPRVIHTADYEQLRAIISWDLARQELGYEEGQPLNIAQICVDRNVDLGRGEKLALVHEGHGGEIRQFTYRDLMLLTNGWAHFLRGLGVRPLDRVCLFLDRHPELYIGLMSVLKTGAIAEPLFSAFGEEALYARASDSAAMAIITERHHLSKVRKIRDRLPSLQFVIVVDHEEEGRPLREGEVALSAAGVDGATRSSLPAAGTRSARNRPQYPHGAEPNAS